MKQRYEVYTQDKYENNKTQDEYETIKNWC